MISHGDLLSLISRYSMSQEHHVDLFSRWWHRFLFLGHRGILRPRIPFGRCVRVMKRPLEVHKVLHLRMITVHLESLHILQYFDSLVLVSRHPIIDAQMNGPKYLSISQTYSLIPFLSFLHFSIHPACNSKSLLNWRPPLGVIGCDPCIFYLY